MRNTPNLGVKPTIIKWARESIGLTIDEVAHRLKREASEIVDWEAGLSSPTYSQLEKLAYEIYKRPLAVFFLPAPPEEENPKREFRTLPTADLSSLLPDTYMHIRKAHAFQYSLKELFNDRNPNANSNWNKMSLDLTGNVTEQAIELRKALGINLAEQITWKSDEKAMKKWRQSIEEIGIFVFKASFKQDDISGFCLLDDQFPLIYVNNSTTKTRQIFSLMHELAHILLKVNGLSKFETDYINRLSTEYRQIEQFCNAIAAEALVPTSDFSEQIKDLPTNIERIAEQCVPIIAQRYGISREAILRRFLDIGYCSAEFYRMLSAKWTSQTAASGGGSYFLNINSYISPRFSREVITKQINDQLTVQEAANHLGINAKSYSKFESTVLRGNAV